MAFALAAAWINPFRFVFTLDDFAYARMVRHFLETGHYVPDQWTAANLPFQTLWGALFSLPFGYSPSALRISTMAVLLLALGCLYELLRDHGSTDQEAGLLTGVFMASPVVLMLAFTFMTDVHFVGWLIVAIFFYSRALDTPRTTRQRWIAMLLGSLAGFAAVGARQLGVALVAGLAAVWLFDGSRRKRVPLYLAGLALPLVALVWQYQIARAHPTLTQDLRLVEQRAFLNNTEGLTKAIGWRPTVITQYVAWFLAPLAPLFLQHFIDARGKAAALGRARPVRPALLCVAVGLFYYGCFVVGETNRMPSLDWLLNMMEGGSNPEFRTRLHYATAGFGALLYWLVLRQYVPAFGGLRTTLTDKLLGLVTLTMLAANISFVVLGDRYAIVYLPFAIWVIGRTAGRYSRFTRLLILAGLLGELWWSAHWTYKWLEPANVRFLLGEDLVSRGIPASDISIEWPFTCYHGAYDDWIETQRGVKNPNLGTAFPFINGRASRGRYAVVDQLPADGSYEIVTERDWKDDRGRARKSWAIDRRPPPP